MRRKSSKGNVMKKIPNILCILRIILSFSFLLIRPFSGLFLAVYLICGFTDMIDGYIARKINALSTLGAALDSTADAVFIGILMVVLLPVMNIPGWIWICIAVIASVRAASVLTAYYRYRKIAMLHTYANKVTGLILFAVPVLYSYMDMSILGGIVCTIALLSAVEELLIQIRSKELNRDIKGIFEGHTCRP